MKVLLIALGSYGDVHPFVGIGRALRSRGHHVTVAANGTFQSLVNAAGLSFRELGTAEEYRRITENADLWDGLKGTRLVFAELGRQMRPVYQTVMDQVAAGDTVVVASTLAFGARIAQDKHGVPTVTVHLQPIDFRSAYEFPASAGPSLPKNAPPWLRRIVYWLADYLLFDRMICPPINEFRKELGLPPVKRILDGWWNSPQRVIGLFPEWFAPPQKDWPPQAVLTGFPLYDEREVTPMSAELLAFLEEGEPPIAFTPGSAMHHGGEFFFESVAACGALGKRGLLLSRHAEHIPDHLPARVRHVTYAPFGELFPRCAAVVHHGGIGTSAQGLAAGVPQLIMPMGHDQPDNAQRLKRLGVAEVVAPKKYRGPRVAEVLRGLLSSSEVRLNCKRVAGRMDGPLTIDRTCELIERLRGVR